MFDSHCHLHDERLYAEAQEVMVRARQAGLSGLLLAGVDAESWARQDLLRRQFDQPGFSIGVSYGVHPQIVPTLTEAQLADQLARLEKAVRGQLSIDGSTLLAAHAIGELGLDAYTEQTRQALPLQERAFRAQLALSRELDLPIVLHILRTHPASLRILKSDGIPRAGGVVHSFSGSAELCAQYVALGLSISFAGGVTLAHAPRLWAAAQAVPRERLLVETDAPDQTPRTHRPARCEPAFLSAVIGKLAALRGETALAIAEASEENARRLFRLPMPSVSSRSG